MDDLLEDPQLDRLGPRERAARVNRAFLRTFWITGALGVLYVWVLAINSLAHQWRPASDWLVMLLLLHVVTPVGFLLFGLGPAFVASLWTSFFPESFLGWLPETLPQELAAEGEQSSELAAAKRQNEYESRVFRRVFWISGMTGTWVAAIAWLIHARDSLPGDRVAWLIFSLGTLAVVPVGIILFGLGPAMFAMAWIQLTSASRRLSGWLAQRRRRGPTL